MDKKTSAKPRTTNRGPWDNFPTCHICHGMKQGRGQSEEDLKKLFEEAEALRNESGQSE